MTSLSVVREAWPFTTPFAIARGVQVDLEVIVVTIDDGDGNTGRGEAAGVDYDGETIDSMIAQVRSLRDVPTRQDLQTLLPPGGARNAVDCALWDLEAKQTGRSASAIAGLSQLTPLGTASTIGLGTMDEVRAKAAAMGDWPLIKIKLDRERGIDVVRAVRAQRPTSALIVDPNQAWTIEMLNAAAPALADLGVKLIEQPLPIGCDPELREYVGPVPLAADESCSDRSSLGAIAPYYDAINVKLDKTGGLTEALALIAEARLLDLDIMVGCMAGTSLAMAPGMIAAQGAAFVDLDGPLLHSRDRPFGIVYRDGLMHPYDRNLWG